MIKTVIYFYSILVVKRGFKEDAIYLTMFFYGKEVDYRYVELDLLNLVAVINDILHVHKQHKYDDETFRVTAIILWSKEKKELKTDYELIDCVKMVKAKRVDSLHLHMDLLPLSVFSPSSRRLFLEIIIH